MRSRWHILITLSTLPIVIFLTGNLFVSFSWVCFGILIDIDHELDYILKYRKITFNINGLSHMSFEDSAQVFHCLEFIPVIFAIFGVAGIIYTIHLVMDVNLGLIRGLRAYSGIYKLWWWSQK